MDITQNPTNRRCGDDRSNPEYSVAFQFVRLLARDARTTQCCAHVFA